MPWSLNAHAAEAYTSLCEERIKQINTAGPLRSAGSCRCSSTGEQLNYQKDDEFESHPLAKAAERLSPLIPKISLPYSQGKAFYRIRNSPAFPRLYRAKQERQMNAKLSIVLRIATLGLCLVWRFLVSGAIFQNPHISRAKLRHQSEREERNDKRRTEGHHA